MRIKEHINPYKAPAINSYALDMDNIWMICAEVKRDFETNNLIMGTEIYPTGSIQSFWLPITYDDFIKDWKEEK